MYNYVVEIPYKNLRSVIAITNDKKLAQDIIKKVLKAHPIRDKTNCPAIYNIDSIDIPKVKFGKSFIVFCPEVKIFNEYID